MNINKMFAFFFDIPRRKIKEKIVKKEKIVTECDVNLLMDKIILYN